ncbi:hypothetical protein [Geminocystis sp. NIES-3708]|uniref:hypothetical protein n=1 Tax=Geminocystis sp. NIES-3708 TaxID=1615909 RepID=UPI00082CB9BE|nr:hypothetical protein [Geminocystis sp. NIES-3708]
MSTKQVLFRLEDSNLIAFDTKLKEKGISKQFFLVKCVELFLEDKLSLDSNELSNDSSEIMELKKQIAVILKRLDRIEDDSKLIAFDTSIATNELDNNDSSELSNDSLSIQSNEDKEDITESIALSESPILPLNEDSPHNVPLTENKAVNSEIISNDSEVGNLSDKEKDILERMKAIESGTTFDSQSKLGDYLGLTKSEKPHLSKLKDLWVDKLFSIDKVNGSNKLTRL